MDKIIIKTGDITKENVCAIINAANSSLMGGGNAGNLQAKYVIHTVGPIYHQCGKNCAELLASCYTNALKIAVELGCNDIAFPAISTGIYGYPKEKAACIAYKMVKDFLEERDDLKATFIFHNNEDKEIFVKTIQEKC